MFTALDLLSVSRSQHRHTLPGYLAECRRVRITSSKCKHQWAAVKPRSLVKLKPTSLNGSKHPRCWADVKIISLAQWEMSGQTLSGHGECTVWPRYSLELSTNIREVSQCPETAPTEALSLFKAPSSAFTIKNLLRHYAKVFKYGK